MHKQPRLNRSVSCGRRGGEAHRFGYLKASHILCTNWGLLSPEELQCCPFYKTCAST